MSTPRSTDFDAIVVGSGATGGWAAKELSEKGLKVLILERGKNTIHRSSYVGEHLPPWEIPFRGKPLRELYRRDYPVQSGSYAFNETTRHFFINDRENPYVSAPEKPFTWIRADAVGGRSLIWGRQVYRWSNLDFEANLRDGGGAAWPITYRDLAPWYSHVERFIGVSGAREGLPHLPDGEFQPPMAMNAVELDFKARVEANFESRKVIIGRVANLTQPLDQRGACHYCGPCERGCSTGSYFSSVSSTLPAAMAAGNLTILADSAVEKLDYDPAMRRISAVRVIDTKTRERRRYTAKMVFMCASTASTIQILLNSACEQFPQGLGNTSGVLGKYVMDHVCGSIYGGIPGFEGIYPYGVRPTGCYVPRFINLDGRDPGITFDRGFAFQLNSGRAEWPSQSLVTPGFGAEFKRKVATPGEWGINLIYFGECLPYKDNTITLHKNKVDHLGIPVLEFNVSFRDNEKRLAKRAYQTAVEMFGAAGSHWITQEYGPWSPGSGIHEMGGARMGSDSRISVLNAHNQSHDINNLFVTDGASMVSSSCVNPTLTFMALTARAANYAVEILKSREI